MKNKMPPLQHRVLRLSRLHFFYIFALAALTIVYDAAKIISPETLLQRWTTIVIMLVVTTVIWYLARIMNGSTAQKVLVLALVIMDILVATVIVYSERGMASNAVALYAVPIIASSALLHRSTLLATASLCTAFYSLAAVRYFVVNFNEGYKVELFSTILFYNAIFFLLAFFIWVVIQPSKK